jgi:uncharacterized membrane protein (UPF0127 family)
MNKSNLTKIAFSLCIIMLAVTLYYYKTSQKPCPLSHYQSTTVQINGHKITTDIASTEDQRICGLAKRSSLPDDYGMLFIYDKNQILDFWMKDTLFPLTVAYIDENHLIMELHQFAALQTNINEPSKTPGRYALEASPKWFIENNIHIGDYVEFSLP